MIVICPKCRKVGDVQEVKLVKPGSRVCATVMHVTVNPQFPSRKTRTVCLLNRLQAEVVKSDSKAKS